MRPSIARYSAYIIAHSHRCIAFGSFVEAASKLLPRIFLPRHFMSGHSSRSSSRFFSLFLFLIYRSKYNSYFNSLSPPHNYRSLPLWCCDYGSIAFWINACNDVVLWFTFNLIFNCFEVILIYPWWHFYNILFDCCKLII